MSTGMSKKKTAEQASLVAGATLAVSGLPALCSPPGALSLLPSLLWLVTGVLKGAAEETSETDLAAAAPQVEAALQALQVSSENV